MASHTKLARAAGATDAEIEAVRQGELSAFSDKDAAAIRWGEWITDDSKNIPDAEFEWLRRHYTEGEIVELTSAAGLFNYFNRFNNALHIEITAAPQK
ncbi:MAG: carboxymuconolactone decarboxylase family protein [Planctomycetes bacterium]|nr:carboxymuconolactone decarboxylase family protein [Planctomycetota bacterium]